MNLLFIYGPPASGKLTIAEEIAKVSNFKLFHNHLTQDLAKELYPEFDEFRFGLVDKLRLATFQYAAQRGTNVVSTYVYSNDADDDSFINQTVDIVQKAGGKVFFVQLEAPDEILLERVGSKSRQRFHKLKDASVLGERLKAGKYGHSVKQPNTYKLDSSKLAPRESARLILKQFQIID